MPLKHLSEAQVGEIIARATALNLAFPESEDGIEMHDPKAMQEVSTYWVVPNAHLLIARFVTFPTMGVSNS